MRVSGQHLVLTSPTRRQSSESAQTSVEPVRAAGKLTEGDLMVTKVIFSV